MVENSPQEFGLQAVVGTVVDTGYCSKIFPLAQHHFTVDTSQANSRFKAKIKMAPGDTQQAFWMIADMATPHIDVARFEKGKLWCNYFWSAREGQVPAKSQSKTGGAKYTNDFFIITLEWSPNKLVWKINDKVFKTQTSGVPQEEMYMIFSTALKEGAPDTGLPAAMEIDWVRVYNLKD